MKKILVALALGMAMITGTCAVAQDKAAGVTDLQALRAAVKTDKRAFVAATLGLTDAEAKKFWPAYDDYQLTLDASNRQRNLVIEDVIALNKPLTDANARRLAGEFVAADELEIKARRKLLTRVLKAVPATKAARYMQLEDKIRDAAAYDIAAAIPLVK